MAAITDLVEEFDGGAAGANLTGSNSKADNVSPAGALTFNNDAYTGTRSLDVVASANNPTARFDHTLAGGWRGIAFKPITPDLTPTAIMNWWAGTTKGGDIRWTPDNRIHLRNVNTIEGGWESAPLTSGEWYYITWRISPNLRIRIFRNGTLFADSGEQGAATVPQSDNLRVGLLSSSSAHCRFDRLRGDTTTEPDTGLTAPTAVAVFTQQRVAEVNTNGSSGVMTLVQTGGEAATVTGPVNSVFRIVLPSTFTADLTFTLTATDGASTDTKTVIVPAPPSGTSSGGGDPLVFTGTIWE